MQSALQQIACTAPTLLEAGARHRSPPGAVPSHIIRLEQAARFCDTANRRSAAAPPEIIALSIAMREIIRKKHPDYNPASTATAPTPARASDLVRVHMCPEKLTCGTCRASQKSNCISRPRVPGAMGANPRGGLFQMGVVR